MYEIGDKVCNERNGNYATIDHIDEVTGYIYVTYIRSLQYDGFYPEDSWWVSV